MANGPTLQAELQSLIGVRTDGKANVYFQPPESVKLNYPCIVYKRSLIGSEYADNRVYKDTDSYEITLIGKDPDWNLPKTFLRSFEMIRNTRNYVSANLYHHVFSLHTNLRRI